MWFILLDSLKSNLERKPYERLTVKIKILWHKDRKCFNAQAAEQSMEC